jgi:FKBP-type peptidyl-prolyl cis-trans isomerase
MVSINKPSKEKTKSVAKRAGWLFLTVLFIVTGLGVGVAAFWQATHQPKDNTSQTTPPPPTANACTAGTEENVEKLPAPEIYKQDGKVTQLQTTDLQEGSGQAAKNGDCLVMKYYGTLASNGTKFDENYTKPEGFKFQLGQGVVIKGWDQGLVGMKVGGTRRLVIPAALGYGSQAAGTIPANSDLVFIVKLESIK